MHKRKHCSVTHTTSVVKCSFLWPRACCTVYVSQSLCFPDSQRRLNSRTTAVLWMCDCAVVCVGAAGIQSSLLLPCLWVNSYQFFVFFGYWGGRVSSWSLMRCNWVEVVIRFSWVLSTDCRIITGYNGRDKSGNLNAEGYEALGWARPSSCMCIAVDIALYILLLPCWWLLVLLVLLTYLVH